MVLALEQCIVVVRDGLRRVKEVLENYLSELYEYNSRIRGTGYYLKPVHMVTKWRGNSKRTYYYYGRYWWRLEYRGRRGKTSLVRWVYVGREKPEGLPEPPRNPLEGLKFYVIDGDVYMSCNMFRKFKWIFEGLKVICVEGCEEPSPQPDR